MDDSLTAEEIAIVKKALQQNQPRRKTTDEKVLAKQKTGVCGKCSKHGNQGCGKNAEKHLAAIARLGLSKYASRPPSRCAEHGQHSHTPQKAHSCNKGKCSEDPASSRVTSVQTDGDIGECDDTSSQDDTCSERSNSTSTSNSTAAHKDPKHCDCCYCEVFGHGVPTVAPVSRNYQEMRERLRMRLKEKRSKPPQADLLAKSRPVPVPASPLLPDKETKSDPTKEEDLDSLLQFIEGNRKEECLDEKKAAKRARQKQKKQEEKEEKERQEREAERQRLEALKRMTKKERKAALRSEVLAQRAAAAAAAAGGSITSPRKQKVAAQPAPPAAAAPTPVIPNSNFRNLVNVNNNNNINGAPPKMVTIRRVMEPYSSEPTVTITIKGSSPDKDEVLFTLNNSSTVQQPPVSGAPVENEKAKKKKKKKENEVEVKPVAQHSTTSQAANQHLKNKKLKKDVVNPTQPTSVQSKPAVKNSKVTVPINVVDDKKKGKSAQSSTVLNQKNIKSASKIHDVDRLTAKNASNKTLNGLIRNDSQQRDIGHAQTKEVEVTVTSVRRQGDTDETPVYRLSEFLNCMKPGSSPPKEEITLESLKLPPGITITKIDGPATKTIRASENPGPVTKGHNAPLVMTHATNGAMSSPVAMGTKVSPISHPAVKSPSVGAGNVIVVDTGRLKQVMKENGISSSVSDAGKKKKKKKKGGEEFTPAGGVGEQATIIKTSDNMVTIRSPQLQHAIDMQAVNANGISDGLRGLTLEPQDSLSQQMKRMSLADARAAVFVSSENSKKQKKKKKGRGNKNDEDVDQMEGGINYAESVFEPKDIDLDNGDIDDDERELEAFKRFCLQSVPPRKDKVKVNLNIKDIVLKKKSSAIGCS